MKNLKEKMMGAEVLSRYQIIAHTTNSIWNQIIEKTIVFNLGMLQIHLLDKLGLAERIGTN